MSVVVSASNACSDGHLVERECGWQNYPFAFYPQGSSVKIYTVQNKKNRFI